MNKIFNRIIKSVVQNLQLIKPSYFRGISSVENATNVSDTIIINKDGPLTLIGINRPEQKNCIDNATALKLCVAISKFEEDKNSSIGVLYGVGGSFCAGHDLDEFLSETIKPELLTLTEGSVGPTRRFIEKPMVCAINGYCVANGLELALLCDLRVMEESAILGFLNRRFGIPSIDGGTVRLPAMVGLSRALDLILTGRSVTAKESFEMGLANRIVATGTALGQAVNLAHCLAKFPQAALLHDRSSIYNSVYDSKSFDEAIQYEVLKTTKEVLDEASKGAAKFKKSGVGRGGKSYNICDKIIPDWEEEEILRENEFKLKTENLETKL